MLKVRLFTVKLKLVKYNLNNYFNLGTGLEIIYNVLSEIKPTDVIQLKFDERQDLNLHSEIVNDNIKSTLFYTLWYFISTVKNYYAKAPQLR